jgi:hypothetical protein
MTPLLLALAVTQFHSSPTPSEGHISLALACTAGQAEVKVVLGNVGEGATGALLGSVVGNYRWYLPAEMTFEAAEGRLIYSPVDLSGVAGRVDPWIVVLPGKSSFSFLVRAIDLMSAGYSRLTAFRGDLRVSLTGRALKLTGDAAYVSGMPVSDLWTGTAVSNTLNTSNCVK